MALKRVCSPQLVTSGVSLTIEWIASTIRSSKILQQEALLYEAGLAMQTSIREKTIAPEEDPEDAAKTKLL